MAAKSTLKLASCQTAFNVCNDTDFVRLVAAIAERRLPELLRPPLFRSSRDEVVSRRCKAAFGAQPPARRRRRIRGMGRGAGSALLFARFDAPAVITRDLCPTLPAGAGNPTNIQPRRPACRRVSACRRPAGPASASFGAAAARARYARPLPGGRPVARPSESRTWPTRCSSTPPIRRRRALS